MRELSSRKPMRRCIAERETYSLEKAGYEDIHVTHWMQYPEDWDEEKEVV